MDFHANPSFDVGFAYPDKRDLSLFADAP